MGKPVLIIVNGLPGTGKTMLARQLGADLHLPVFARDSIYETLYDALKRSDYEPSPLLGTASFSLLYFIVGTLLGAGKSLIVEHFFGQPELRTAEFLHLQQAIDFEPFQILCKADGKVLLERFLARVGTAERHSAHPDLEWLAQNKEWLLQGRCTPLALEGQLIEIDTTTPESFEYGNLLQQIQRIGLR